MNSSVPLSMRYVRVDEDLNALWVVEPGDNWSEYASIARGTDVVMSFRISAMFTNIGKDFAFFLANRMRDIYRDGARQVRITGFCMAVDLCSTIGFVTFTNIENQWFDIVRASTLYNAVIGTTDTFFATRPSSDAYLNADSTIEETLEAVRCVIYFFP